MKALTDQEKQAVSDVAAMISPGIGPQDLAAVIMNESSFNPAATTTDSSGIMHGGLIQISDTNAQKFGYSGASDLLSTNPDIESQLRGPVLDYFNYVKKTFGPINNAQDLATAVYAPALLGKPTDTGAVDVVSGLATVQDYLNRVNAAGASTASIEWPEASMATKIWSLPGIALVEDLPGNPTTDLFIIFGVLAGAGFLYWYLNRPRKRR
jgi:hypothetical protein